ncbi:MAG: paraquat-inducible protein A [Alphaproteobacteria bacterium]
MSRRTLHNASRGVDRWTIGPALLLALALLVAGVALPSLTVRTFAVLSNSVSVLSGLAVLWSDDQYFLFAVLLVFSVLFPVAKLLLGLWVWFAADIGRRGPAVLVDRLEALAKWSMLDVLVIAMIVAALNLTVISGVFVHAGLYLFTASVVLSKVVLARIGRAAGRRAS